MYESTGINEPLLWSEDLGRNCEEILTYVSSFYPSTNSDKLSDHCLSESLWPKAPSVRNRQRRSWGGSAHTRY